MRKVVLFNLITLDGFFEGLKQEIDWHHVDEEFHLFANNQMQSAGTLLFGRITYDLMAGYWPTPAAIQNDPVTADQMNSISKIVFSGKIENA